jgi:hypothetical protein
VSEVELVVRDTLAAHKSMYLATSGSAGPWVGGVYFAEVDVFTLGLVLEQRGRTLAAIRENPEVALVVAAGTPMEPFLQARATATIAEDDADSDVRQRLLRKVPECAPFLEMPITAIRLTVPTWRVTDIRQGWLPGKELTA